jgi:ribose transport system substrate-binding protein
MESAKAVGRNDIAIVTIDLGDTSARSIATGGMIKCSGTSRSYDQGVCEAYCAAYSLLGKEVPSTYVTPVALPVVYDNLLEGYCQSYGLTEAPQWLADLYNQSKNS